jgi:YaaC-like Protein
VVMQQDNWSLFDMFFSSQKTQHFLAKQYKKFGFQDSSGKSFDNTFGFIYYIEHGKKYYTLANQAPVELKPVLLFYGMTQLMKACILCTDPDYPDSSSVLAHGLSTRKRKKRSYEFFNDEVKVQKTGLFNHFCEKLFHMKHIEGEKFMMNHLLKTLPELGSLYKQMTGSIHQIKMDKESSNSYSLTGEAANFLHMSGERFMEYINSTLSSNIRIELNNQSANNYRVFLKENLHAFNCFPLSYHFAEKTYYFPVDRDLMQLPELNELMVHYVLLYNLSMISRYDTEWWSELFHTYTSEELPFINQFLNLTGQKIPYLFGQLLHTMDIP